MRFNRLLILFALAGAAAPTLTSAQVTTHIVVRKAGFLGISPQLTSETRDGKTTTSIIVTDVVPGSPADKAGVKKGDSIVRIDGKAVSLPSFKLLGSTMQPGDTVRLRLSSAGRERDATLVATERPADFASGPVHDIVVLRADSAIKLRRSFMDSARVAMPLDSLLSRFDIRINGKPLPHDSLLMGKLQFFRDSLPRGFRFEMVKPGAEDFFEMGIPHLDLVAAGRMGVAGAEFTELNPGLSQYFGASKGLLVLRVGPGTPAARAGLEAGDVITRVDGREIENVEQFRTTMLRTRDATLKLDILRKGKTQSLTLDNSRRRD